VVFVEVAGPFFPQNNVICFSALSILISALELGDLLPTVGKDGGF